MAEPVSLVSPSGATSTVGTAGFVRIEVQLDGKSLTFDVQPATSKSQALGKDRRRLFADLCCGFGADLRLSIVWTAGEILALRIAELDFLRTWKADPVGRGPLIVLRRHDPGHRSALARAVLRNVRLRSEKRLPPLVLYLEPLPDRPDSLVPVLVVEASAEPAPADAFLLAFGEVVPWPAEASALRIAQVPSVLMSGPGEPPAARRWLVGIDGLPFTAGRGVWNAVVEACVEGVALDRQEATVFVPRFGPGDRETRHSWRFLVELGDPELGKAPPAALAGARSLGLAPSLGTATTPRVDLEFPRLLDHDGSPLRGRLQLAPPSRQPTAIDADLAAYRALHREPGLVLQGALGFPLWRSDPAPQSPVRFDTLDLRFVEAKRRLPTPHERCFVRWEVAPRGWGAHAERYFLVAADSQMLWLLDGADAGAAHSSSWSAPDFDDDADPYGGPVVVTRNRLSQSSPALLLRATDRQHWAAGGQPAERVIELFVERLLEQRPGVQPRPPAAAAPEDGMGICPPAPDHERVVVVAQEPMLVAQVSFPALGSPGAGSSAGLVARWSTRGPDAGGWRMLLAGAGNACLTMPPQAVGEGVVKDRRSLAENALADFRFSPPALVALREQLGDRQSFAVPWDLLHLLTRTDLGLPGAQVDHLQYELLYGLSCRLDSELLRLAEIGALVGQPPPGLKPTPAWLPSNGSERAARTAYDAARARWARTRRTLRGRLGIFELWNRDSLEAMELQSGVTCWIRGHRPLTEGEIPPRRPPELAEVPEAELADPFADPAAAGPDDGLRGGATYGFESRNVYRAVMRPSADNRWPRSDDAGTSHLRLSALGGYGNLAAQFDAKRSRILADVSLGRTYAYTLERIGRIGVWWNRAKHVIVYERTVLPSRQFIGDQNPHAGRAVVRKVVEYVEILQNARNYPEAAAGDPRAVGAVRCCAFAAKEEEKVVRFLVRSDWGADVGDYGWKVPIWVPNAQPADLYPKPVVKLEVLSGPDGGGQPQLVTIADPENLYFWTDTTPPDPNGPLVDLSNSDLWVAVEGIDYVKAPPPQAADEPAFAAGRLEQTATADGVIAPALRPCTFLLEPTVHTVDLLANRDAEPMGSTLSSLTLMREPPARPAPPRTPDTPVVPSLEQALQGLKDRLAAEVLDWQSLIARGQGLFDPARLRNSLRDACRALGGEAARLEARYTQASTEAATYTNTLINQAESDILAAIDNLFDQALFRAMPHAEEQSGLLERGLDLALRSLRDVRAATDAERLAAWKELLRDDIEREVGQGRALIAARLPSPSAATDLVRPALREVEAQLVALQARVEQMRRDIADFRSQRLDPASFHRQVTGYLATFASFLDRLDGVVGAARRVQVKVGGVERKVPAAHVVRQWIKTVESALADGTDVLAAMAQRGREAEALLREYQGRLGAQAVALRDRIVGGIEACLPNPQRFAAAVEQIRIADVQLAEIDALVAERRDGGLDSLEAALLTKVDDILASLPTSPRPQDAAQLAAWTAEWDRVAEEQHEALRALVGQERAKLRAQLQSLATDLRTAAADIDTLPLALRAPAEWAGRALDVPELSFSPTAWVTARCADLDSQLTAVLAAVGEQAEAARAFVEAAGQRLAQEIGRELGDALRLDEGTADTVAATGDKVLRLVRAFGKPPEVAGLNFDRPEVAFLYDELDNRVGITPVIARAAQVSAVADALKPLGIDLPVTQLAAKLMPAALENFDLSSIFPNIAGIPLQNLFGGAKLPSAANDAIKVTHGLDPKTKRGWVNVAADVQLPKTVPMFAFGPLSVVMREPQLVATARMEADLEGKVTRRVEGRLAGDWQLVVGGCELINFRQTALEFDGDGNIRYKIDPSQVELAPAFAFINDLLSTLSPGGLSIRFTGGAVVSSLDLPIPDTQLGAFGFASLTLSASLSLHFLGDFKIGITAGLARRDAPFTLTVFVLGGGGYIQVGAEYTPKTGKIDATADLAIAASASLAIALGPIRGGVAVYVGITAQYHSGRGGGLIVGVMFMIRGHVSILSIVTATIVLRLDAQYANGSLIGTGFLEVKIKICWCFTLEVSETVQYTLAGSGNQQASLAARPLMQLASLDPAAYFHDGGPPETLDPKVLGNRISDYVDMLV